MQTFMVRIDVLSVLFMAVLLPLRFAPEPRINDRENGTDVPIVRQDDRTTIDSDHGRQAAKLNLQNDRDSESRQELTSDAQP